MSSDTARDASFDQLVEELRGLGSAALMLAWREVRARLEDEGPLDLAEGHRLRQRHFAFRKVAAERFGTTGHVEHYRAMFGG